jgi:PIN domain nuclease of toxin-antitoxin system
MSPLLLDTHIWLWYAEGNEERLPTASVKKLDRAHRAEGLRVSSISVWEVGMLHGKGRVQVSAPLRDWVKRALAPTGISLLTLRRARARTGGVAPTSWFECSGIVVVRPSQARQASKRRPLASLRSVGCETAFQHTEPEEASRTSEEAQYEIPGVQGSEREERAEGGDPEN